MDLKNLISEIDIIYGYISLKIIKSKFGLNHVLCSKKITRSISNRIQKNIDYLLKSGITHGASFFLFCAYKKLSDKKVTNKEFLHIKNIIFNLCSHHSQDKFEFIAFGLILDKLHKKHLLQVKRHEQKHGIKVSFIKESNKEYLNKFFLIQKGRFETLITNAFPSEKNPVEKMKLQNPLQQTFLKLIKAINKTFVKNTLHCHVQFLATLPSNIIFLKTSLVQDIYFVSGKEVSVPLKYRSLKLEKYLKYLS